MKNSSSTDSCRRLLLLLLLLLLTPLPQLLAAPATPAPTGKKATSPSSSLLSPPPAIVFAADNGDLSCPTNVRPPDCADGFRLTLTTPRRPGCPLYRCEAGQEDSERQKAEDIRDAAELQAGFSTGCSDLSALSKQLPAACPGSQVVKTVLERRPGAPGGWCQSRRCACPELDDTAAACIADNRTVAILAREKLTNCRLLVECRLRRNRKTGCLPPPVCGPGVAPERQIRNATDCPVYSCPMAGASSTNATELVDCPPTSPTCPTGSVSVIVDAGDYVDSPVGCPPPHRVVCEPLQASPTPTPPQPSPPTLSCPLEPAECPPGELAVPLVSTGVEPTRCPQVACLAMRVPAWLPVCPFTPRHCGGGGGGLRTELSVTEFGVLCVRVACRNQEAAVEDNNGPGQEFRHWGPPRALVGG